MPPEGEWLLLAHVSTVRPVHGSQKNNEDRDGVFQEWRRKMVNVVRSSIKKRQVINHCRYYCKFSEVIFLRSMLFLYGQ